MKKIAVLISNTGTGTNLQAIINGIEQKKINAKIVAVISDTQEAQGLRRAKKNHLPIVICSQKKDLLLVLQKYTPDYIALGGWKQIIVDEVINAFEDKILNVHPGLIPDSIEGIIINPDGTNGLWNRKKLTERAIKIFLDSKATYAGSSIHFLTKEFDFGKVVARCFEKIKSDDTIESLYARLKKKENAMFVKVLQKLCQNSNVKS